MKDDIDKLVDYYTTVTDGQSALLEEDFNALCTKHTVPAESFSYCFSREIAERFVAGKIDFDGGDFAMNDLFWANRGELKGLALDVFYAFEDGEFSYPQESTDMSPWLECALSDARKAWLECVLSDVRKALMNDDISREV